ncbi:unnamed protein product [Bemisia tabaci]|uniref:C2H2-type domain-containing protein n=2 Tax=Bemisia tabaci TaxID=7038 RepID=A0A9P0AJ15_BEMTA|nr:unnamed protein product [Bemisia tabaci]
MPVCFKCKDNIASFQNLKLHFRVKHALNPDSIIRCAEAGCIRSYSSMKNFAKHFKNTHETHGLNQVNLPQNNEIVQAEDPVADEPNPPSPVPSVSSTHELINILDDVNIPEAIKEQCAIFVSKLNSNLSIPRSAGQKIINHASDLIATFTSLMQGKIKTFFNKEGGPSPDDFAELDHYFSLLQSPFHDVASEYKRLNYFKERGTYIAPQSIEFGYRTVVKTRRARSIVTTKRGLRRVVILKRKERCFCRVKITGEFIPLSQTLKIFFEYGNIFSDTLKFMDSLLAETNVIRNIVQGTYWRSFLEELKNKGSNKCYLPLLIYADEFEAGNPLGSHSGINKLCGVYGSVPCLPLQYQSKLTSIFLCSMFKANNRKLFGNKKIFKKLIDELNSIEDNGVMITVNGMEKVVFFKVCLLVGDNLGLNQICGFKEHFNSDYCCRICRITIAELNYQTKENLNIYRNPENYAADVATNNVTLTGVKEKCVWNDIVGFDVTLNLSLDLLHDVWEGVAGFDVIFILNYLIDFQFLSFDTLCLRISDFDYGLIDSRNKPPAFSKNFTIDSLKLSASEMIVLVKYLPLILGDYVPEDDEVWSILLKLREITDLLMAPALQTQCAELMQLLIQEHHEIYLKVTKSHLKFKHHCLLHYPTFFLRHGPLRHVWTMRFEGKNKVYKTIAYAIASRRNVEKSVSIKHQLYFSDLISSQSLVKESIEYGLSTTIRLNDLAHYKINEKIARSGLPHSLLSVSWVEINSTFKPSMMVLNDISDDNPIFAEIEEILITEENTIYFICSEYETVSFLNHYHAYSVLKMKTFTLLKYDDLLSQVPLTLSVLEGRRYFVTLNHSL